jgi:hypothetical protein
VKWDVDCVTALICAIACGVLWIGAFTGFVIWPASRLICAWLRQRRDFPRARVHR